MPRETRSDTSPPAGLGDAAIGSGLSENGIFRKEGEYWTIGYGNNASLSRNALPSNALPPASVR